MTSSTRGSAIPFETSCSRTIRSRGRPGSRRASQIEPPLFHFDDRLVVGQVEVKRRDRHVPHADGGDVRSVVRFPYRIFPADGDSTFPRPRPSPLEKKLSYARDPSLVIANSLDRRDVGIGMLTLRRQSLRDAEPEGRFDDDARDPLDELVAADGSSGATRSRSTAHRASSLRSPPPPSRCRSRPRPCWARG